MSRPFAYADDFDARPKTVVEKGTLKVVTTLEALNARFAMLEQDGSPSVYVSRRDCLPVQDCDLRRRLAGEVVEIGQKDGNPIYSGAFAFWTGHADRHVFRRVVFTSRPISGDSLNLFRGLGVKPRAGKCEKIIRHIREVICSGNSADADAMLKLLAWQLQNIGRPSRIVTVLKSEKQQAGKGILLSEVMTKIYGPSGFTAASTDQILGRFNSAIRGRSFIFLDEVLFAGDRKAADNVKSLATATLMGIEEKGLPVVQCPVGVNLWLASNHVNAAHVEEHDARYWVLDVSPHRVGDAAYFAGLMTEINNGGREAFAHHLLAMDVSGFVPSRDVPKDNAVKMQMVRESVNPFDARKWLEDCAQTGRLIGIKRDDSADWIEWVEGEEYPFARLAAAYVEWQKTVRARVKPDPTPVGSLGEVLAKAGLEHARTKRERRRVLPSVETCLENIWKKES